MDQHHRTTEEWLEALELKGEKLGSIVYRLWKDLKALANDRYHQKEA